MPEIGFRHRIPGPVGGFRIREYDTYISVFLRVVTPHIVVPVSGAFRCLPGTLEPGMLIRGVVDDQLCDDFQVPLMRLPNEAFQVSNLPVCRIEMVIVGYIIAVIPLRGRVEGQQPNGGDAEVLQIVEFFNKPFDIPDTITIAIEKGLDVKLVNDGILIPLIRNVVVGRMVHGGNVLVCVCLFVEKSDRSQSEQVVKIQILHGTPGQKRECLESRQGFRTPSL